MRFTAEERVTLSPEDAAFELIIRGSICGCPMSVRAMNVAVDLIHSRDLIAYRRQDQSLGWGASDKGRRTLVRVHDDEGDETP
jgi:hypothetical protein